MEGSQGYCEEGLSITSYYFCISKFQTNLDVFNTIQLWGHAKKSNIKMMQRVQNKVLWKMLMLYGISKIITFIETLRWKQLLIISRDWCPSWEVTASTLKLSCDLVAWQQWVGETSWESEVQWFSVNVVIMCVPFVEGG